MIVRNKKWLALAILIIALLVASMPLERFSYSYHDAAFKKAIATFAIAKTLNASISFLQGTEIEGSLVFASATFSVGEILDPLNDLVERFSWIMLASAVALGIEKLLIDFSGAMGLKIFIVFFGIFTSFLLWKKSSSKISTYALQLFGILLILRLLMPLAEGTNMLIYNLYSKDIYQQASLSLDTTTDDFKKFKEVLPQKELSFFESINKKFEQTSSDIISMIVIFLLHTVLLPIFFLWLGIKAISALIRFPHADTR